MDIVEEIKSKLDIVAVISDYISLKKTGINYRALCPFHSEKTPSFFVSPNRQMWHCFGCGEGHDMFDFIMKIEGVDFKEALKILAQKAGVVLTVQNPKLKSKKEKIFEIHEQATKFFEYCLLNSITGKKAYQYLLKRGINKASIKKWRIGYSLKKPQGLLDFLTKKGYNNEEIKNTGLIIQRQIYSKKNYNQSLLLNNKRSNQFTYCKTINSAYYDRFQGRIMFPIFNLQEKVIAFGGRFFDFENRTIKKKNNLNIAKYINSPQTEIYNKSCVLYGLDKARLGIRKMNFSILVEGYTDVIMSFQAGIENVVATSGTALTESQLDILGRYSKNLIIGFDADNPGVAAIQKGISLAQKKEFNIKIANLTATKDPAEIIAKNPKKWKKIIVQSLPIVDFYLHTALNKYNSKTLEGKKNIANMVLPKIKELSNKIEQGHWLQRLSEEIETDVQFIKQELKKIKNENHSLILSSSSSTKKTSLLSKKTKYSLNEILEQRLFFLIFKNPEILKSIQIKDIKQCSKFFQEIFLFLKKIINQKQATIEEQQTLIINNLKKHFDTETFKKLSILYFKIELDAEKNQQTELDRISIKKEAIEILEKIKKNKIKNQMLLITQKIKQAEKNKDIEKIEILSKKYHNLSQKIKK